MNIWPDKIVLVMNIFNKIGTKSAIRSVIALASATVALLIFFTIAKPADAKPNTDILVSGEKLSSWKAITTKNFVIYGKKSDKTLVKFAENLESIHYLMLISDGLQGIEDPEKVSIYLVEDSMGRYINNENAAATQKFDRKL